MSLIKRMGEARLSRVTGGIIFDYLRAPIRREKLDIHLANVKNGEGQSRYYHLNEETGVLTRYEKKKGLDYFSSHAQVLTLTELRKMSLAYDVLMGFEPEKYRFRAGLIGDAPLAF